jgi:hypothetical protein
MKISNDILTILGVRILCQQPNSKYDYYIEYEFSGESWKRKAIFVIPLFLNKIDVKFQTLHSFSSSINLQTGKKTEPFCVWLDNHMFNFDDLISLT